MMQQLPIDEALDKFRDLRQLAAEINEHYESSLLTAQKAVGQANEACKAALLCGQYLIKAKAALRHGEWQLWLTENCTLSHVTAARYMRGARRSQGPGQSITQWYYTTGILTEPEKPEPGQPAELTVMRVCRWATTFLGKLEVQIVEAWTDDERQTVMQSLQPLNDLYLSLSHTPEPNA